MNAASYLRRGAVGAVLALACAVGLSACSSEEHTSSSEGANVGTESDYVLAAGDAGVRLGVAQWNLNDSGVVEALDSTANVMASFRILEGRQGVVSLTGEGERVYDGAGAVVRDTLSDLERQLVDAVREDVIAASEVIEEAAHEPGAQKALEWVAFACCAGTLSGTLHHWWSGGWTPYCSIQPIPNTTCDQTVHPQCASLGVARGCSIWL
jgi:hypothetical protein